MVLAPTTVQSSVTLKWNASAVGGITNMRLNFGPQLVDITSIGDVAVSRFPTIVDWTLTIDLVYDPADAGQAKMITDIYTPAKREVIIGIPSSKTLTGDAYIESFDYSLDPKEVVRVTATIRGSGDGLTLA